MKFASVVKALPPPAANQRQITIIGPNGPG